ncbi:MAG: RCC1 domain-containing protein, partial [Limisphaerales bacterium]
PTMGGYSPEPFSVADQQTVTVKHQFPVAAVNVDGLSGTKLWRGRLTLNEWINWQADWKLSADQNFAMLRLAKPGVQPRPVLLQKKGGSFSAVSSEPFVPAGTVEAWGGRHSDIPDAYQNAKFIDVDAGKNHTVGLLEDGQVVCWGDNSFGQSRVAANVGKCIMIAAGDNHTVVLQADGTVLAWGANRTGQSKVPDDLGPCVAISAATERSAAIRADGSISGWGYGSYQLATKTPWRPFVHLSVGAKYIMALDDQATASVFIQTATQVGTPRQQGALATAAGACISATGGASMAHFLKIDGTLVNITSNPRAPKPPTSLGRLATVSAAYDRFAATDANGNVIIWGRKTGITTKYGFERKTDSGQYWYRSGKYLKVVCGESHYVAIKR